MKENVLQVKSYVFTLKIIKAVYHHQRNALLNQLLRCGTSIGANVEEAIGAQSGRDFSAKLAISYKEARETKYWLRLLSDSGHAVDDGKLLNDCEELLRIIGSIQKTIKSNRTNKNATDFDNYP